MWGGGCSFLMVYLDHQPRVVLFTAPHTSAIIHKDASQAHLIEAFP